MGDASLPAPSFEGVTWRAPLRSDAAAIVSLHTACFEVDDTYRIVESEVLERWDSPSTDPSIDALVGFDRDGTLVVSIWSIVPDSAESLWRAFGYENRIHPSLRSDEMRDVALRWWEARSRQRLEAIDDDLPNALQHFLYVQQQDDIDFLRSRGYEIVRYYHELGRDLSVPLSGRPLPEGIEVRSLDAYRGDARDVHNASFRDHWGSQPISVETWNHGFNEFHMPEASFVAYDDGEAVAYVMSEAYPHDFEDRGWRHAWVEGVGTVRSHRKRGLASALITKAMEVMAAAGMEYAILGVDAENPTGAYGLYDDLGFSEMRRELLLQKTL